jgi:hypothetical protein
LQFLIFFYLSVRRAYAVLHIDLQAANAILILGTTIGLDGAVAGTELLVVGPHDDVEDLKVISFIEADQAYYYVT